MKGKFRAITQVSLALLLALSLSLVTAVSVMAVEFPSISPTTAEYDLDDPAEVMTTISWGIASTIEEITDDEGDLEEGLNKDYIVLVKHLIILNTYLEDKLPDIGDEVELIIKFDVGAAALTITATGTQPTISPTTAQYDLDDPDDVETTITWGIAAYVDSTTENSNLLTRPGDYTVGDTVEGEAPLTILNDYLASELTDIGDEVVLTIEFDRGDDATLTITAIGTKPSIDPTTAQYNIDSPADVKTTITWGTADNVDSITENGNPLTRPGDYTVGDTAGGKAPLTILDDYLASELTDIGAKVVLTINFNVGGNATFEITATGVNAAASPQAKNYDLDNPGDVTTTIIWNTADSINSIVDDDGDPLTAGTHYTLTPIDADSDTLTIRNDPYLRNELTAIGEKAVLTIEFDVGANATFTITATGILPVLSPQTKEYDLDSPADAQTTITWGTASNVTSIVDNDNYTLVKNTDYTVTSINADRATLTVLHDPYIEGKHIDIGESLVLTISFDVDGDATFTITAIGIQPSIFPTTTTYDILAGGDVTTITTWGTATSVVSIVDDDEFTLAEDIDYTVTDIDLGVSATLTILGGTYLTDKLTNFGEDVVLTIGFDVGGDATLTIDVPKICFIATAAYGTPMAEEIQILREFRDEYLLTNPLGQALVGVYYRVSPPIAEFITEHPSLKPIVRAGLLPVVAMSTVAVNTTPAEKTAIVGLLVLVSVALAVWAMRRRGRGPEYT
ncbi:MAG: X2-like carbohydrate binding domain-containing protein [Dehalococcoidia bacterium]